jgi:CRP-like cAMP-binding protein
MDPRVLDALRTLLGAQPEAQEAWLVERVVLQPYEPGSAVVLEGQRARDLFLLLEGRLRIGKQRPDKRQERIAYLQPVALLGLASAVLGTAHPTTAVAVEPSLCLRLPRALLRADPAVPLSREPARRLLQATVRGMNAQLRAVNARLLRLEEPGEQVAGAACDLGAWSLPSDP